MKAVLFAVLAGLCWGVGEVFTKAVLHTKQVGPITAIAVRSTVALPVMWLVYAGIVHGLKREPATWPRADGAVLSKLVLGSGLVAGAGGMIFFYMALSFGEVSRVKPIAFALAPTTAVVLGMAALGEAATAQKLVAVALIVLGVVLLATARQT
jgi:transporter family protein